MKFKAFATTSLIAALSFARAEPVMADNSAIVGGIIGGIIGGAIVNEANKSKGKTKSSGKSKGKSSGASSAQREANREVQEALNYFAYNVGTPDGSIGPKSRAAISQYQVLLGNPPTGELTEYERTLLLASYHRGEAGGALVTQTVATHPMGLRGLILMQRDEMAGLTAPADTAPAAAPAATVPEATMATAPTAPTATLPALVAAPAVASPALPVFAVAEGPAVSLASQCNQVSLMTNTNGGYTKAAAVTDAGFALAEQFCLARTYAMAESEKLAGAVSGFTPEQIVQQCQAFGPVLQPQLAALGTEERDKVLAGVAAFVQGSGQSPAQLAGSAKICLGVGYTENQMEVALGSALVLTALGEKAYAELVAHHMSMGFGTVVRADLAFAWYQMGLEAAKSGAVVFAPGLTDRTDVIYKAAYIIGGHTDPAAPAPAAAPELPAFSLARETVVTAPQAGTSP
jgi:peptidoglycan hydrolase-like protein with peptidoglycan-binding domain